ncbi:MAG: hypothetical protein ACLGIE_17660 [Alphaproteobacteria bacterium]|jgi:hypothetical protein
MSEGWQHIEINDHGTVVVLRPISDEGRAWFEDNVGEPEPGGIYHLRAADGAGHPAGGGP